VAKGSSFLDGFFGGGGIFIILIIIIIIIIIFSVGIFNFDEGR